jgi:hypothetical protein
MSCVWPVQINDSNGNALNSTGGSLDVNVTSMPSGTLKATYSVAITGLLGYSPLLQIQGSATKTIKITKVAVCNMCPSGGYPTTNPVDIMISRYSSGATGGAPTTAPAAKFDTTDANATATVTYWTGSTAPTIGTIVADFRAARIYMNTNNPATQSAYFAFGDALTKQPTLQGTGEYLVIRTSPGESPTSQTYFDVWIDWTEE